MTKTTQSEVTPQAVLLGQRLIIEGQEIPVDQRRVPLENIKLDPDNSRIQHAVKRATKNGALGPAQLRKLILEFPAVSDLFKSIRDNGGILDPIYIRPDGRIIEGNCRAASYMKLHDIDRKEVRWQSIPAVLVPNITDRQVAILQGQYHVAGKNKWQAYEKAGHLHRMHTDLKMDEKTIARVLGLPERDVVRDLKTYQTMTEKVLPKLKDGNGLDKWSFVQEFYKNKKLEVYRGKASNVDEFVSLVASKKIKRGADVRKLGEILKHPNAVKALKKQDVDSAMAVVGKADPTADSHAFRHLKKATTLLQHLPQRELERLRDAEKPKAILRDLFTALRTVAKTAGVNLG
jgi:hypothetical protein